jgi:hypothetical protein
VAEALQEITEPLASLVRPGPPAPAPMVARFMARELALPVSMLPPPSWLRPEQRLSFARARAALDCYGGTLLAESVGSGKSWIALALASADSDRGHATGIVPAALMDQWREVSARAGVPIRLWSQERLSRGQLPGGRSGLVVIDESHRFRNSATRRYRTLAPWLVGRRVLLLSATPVVNRLDDLAAQLLLAVPDDALHAQGLPSIRLGLRGIGGNPALGELVINSIPQGGGPERTERRIEFATLVPTGVMDGLDQLTNSRERPVARLLSGIAWRAAASSPAALLSVLIRYRTLLNHAHDALREGRPLDRGRLRSFTGELAEQMVLWSLLAPPADLQASDLDLDDLPRLDALVPAVRAWRDAGDAKLARLVALLADRRITLVFTVARETVRYLRERLVPAVAWSCGDVAGLGSTSVPRSVVWSWFSPEGAWAGAGPGPRVLVSTDVAAEGLDLQRAERVVHYDLPWTQVRMAQRDGRALRLGSLHHAVECVQFRPPAEIERRLALDRILARKESLPAEAGLGAHGRGLWRWREEMGWLAGAGPAAAGCAAVAGHGLAAGALMGVSLHSPGASELHHRTPALFWLPIGGELTHSADAVEAHLLSALTTTEWEAPTEQELALALERLWPVLHARLTAAERGRWQSSQSSAERRGLARRLHRIARAAARRRDAMALASADRGLRFVARGHSAGEEMLAAQLMALSDRALLERLVHLPVRRDRAGPLLPVMTGVLIFR